MFIAAWLVDTVVNSREEGCSVEFTRQIFGFNFDGTLILLINCNVVLLLFVFSFWANCRSERVL